MTNRPVGNEIHTRLCPDCYLCGTRGHPVYQGLKDGLFGTPGEWNFKRCPHPECGLLWLDPMPLEREISKAYDTYLTHLGDSANGTKGTLRGLLRSSFRTVYNLLMLVLMIYPERKRLNSMYLDKTRPGKLLEVGSGNGQLLAEMRALGWEVEGQEVDQKAAYLARMNRGLPIHLGALEDVAFPDGTFDAVVMNHVIEHVHNPVALLAESRRILKPGGTLVCITPNVESYGHKYFGSSWRGLEPPRHLHLFSKKTLSAIGAKASFLKCDAWTTSARAERIGLRSMEIKAGCQHELGRPRKLSRRMWGLGYQFLVSFVHLKDKNSGEECILRALA